MLRSAIVQDQAGATGMQNLRAKDVRASRLQCALLNGLFPRLRRNQDDHDQYLAKDRLSAPPIRPSGRWNRASRATEDHLPGCHISCNIDVPKFEPKLGLFFGQ
jgi:hypothetical protein